MIFSQRSLLINSLIVFHLLFSRILAFEETCSESWKAISVSKTQYENDIPFTSVNPMMSKMVCGVLAKQKGMNSFCFQEGICKLFQFHPCFRFQEISNTEDPVTCFSTKNILEGRRVFKSEAKFNKYAGCFWFSDSILKTFEEANQKCKEDGGQLITFEHFPTEKDFTDFTSKLEHKGDAYVGWKRNGLKGDYKWLTGTTVNKSSFLWLKGEPNSEYLETNCGNMYYEKLDDHDCTLPRKAFCHIYIP